MKNTRRLQIAVVTGASSGMGRETVIQLADRFAWPGRNLGSGKKKRPVNPVGTPGSGSSANL